MTTVFQSGAPEDGKPTLGGEFHRTISHGRVSIPANFKPQLSDDSILFESIDGSCAWLMSEERFSLWIRQLLDERFGGYDPSDTRQMMLRSALLSRAIDIRCDNAGRIVIPSALRERLHLDGCAVLVGMADRIEIWNPAAWEAQRHDAQSAL